MIILSTTDLTLCYGDKVILDSVSFSVNEGDRLGIIGVNGAGKTSLIKMITGEIAATGGAVFISREKSIGLLSQNAGLDGDTSETVFSYILGSRPELMALEGEIAILERRAAHGETHEIMAAAGEELAEKSAAFADAGGLTHRAKCESLLNKTGFYGSDFEKPIEKLSGGQRTRLALARILCSEPDILILDEPTNHLDIDTLVWLEGYLSSYKKTLLVISHDRYFLDKVTTKTLVIEYTHAKLYRGNYSTTQAQREADAAYIEKQYKLQQREIARIEAHIAQQREFAMERNFVTIRSREKMLARMKKIERPKANPRSIKLSFSTPSQAGGNEVLSARELCFSFPDKPLFRDVDFLITRGEFAFFCGANGTGKSTMIKLICGKLKPVSGVIELGYNIKIGYYDQENQGLNPENRVIDELWSAYPRLTETEVRSNLAQFLFRGDDVFKSVSELSGGERARLTLCKLILSKVNLLVLDEPTNHLDIGSRESLEEALADFDGTLIAVSHDRYFIDRLATRIIEINPYTAGGCFDCILSGGGYDEYRSARTELSVSAEAKQADDGNDDSASGRDKYLREKEELAAKRREERKKQQAAERVVKLEAELEALNAELFGKAASDYMKAAEISARITAVEDELLKLYEITG